MSAATASSAEPSKPSANRPLATRSSSRQSSSRQPAGTQGGGYVADNDYDDEDEGDYEGEDGDEDDEELAGTDDGAGGKAMLDETTIKSGYLFKRGEKRKVNGSGIRETVVQTSLIPVFYHFAELEEEMVRVAVLEAVLLQE